MKGTIVVREHHADDPTERIIGSVSVPREQAQMWLTDALSRNPGATFYVFPFHLYDSKIGEAWGHVASISEVKEALELELTTELLTASELGQTLRVTEQSIRAWARSGKIRGLKTPKGWRFLLQEILADLRPA